MCYIYIYKTFTYKHKSLVAPRPTLGHSLGDSLIHPMFITAILLVQPKGYLAPRNQVRSQSPAELISWI